MADLEELKDTKIIGDINGILPNSGKLGDNKLLIEKSISKTDPISLLPFD